MTPLGSIIAVAFPIPNFPLRRGELEVVDQIILFLLAVVEAFQVWIVVLACRDDHVRPFRRQAARLELGVQPVLETGAGQAIYADQLRLEAAGVRPGQKVGQHLVQHNVHPVGMAGQFLPLRTLALDQVLGRLVFQFHLFAHLLEADIERFFIDEERHFIAQVMHFQGSPVLDRPFDAVIAEVALLLAVHHRAEIPMGVGHRSVYRGAGEAEAEGVRQFHPHRHRVAVGAIAFLRAVAFVHQGNEIIVSQRGQIGHFLEGLHSGDQGAAPDGFELALQVFNAQRLFHVWIIAGVEVVSDLGFQVAAIHHDDHGGVFQRRLSP